MTGEGSQRDHTELALRVLSGMSTVFLDVLAALVIVLITRTSLFGLSAADAPKQGEEKQIDFIVARLVKLGVSPDDPAALPHRKVPALATGPKENVPLSSELDPPKHDPVSGEKAPPSAVDDPKLRKIFDTARAFAEITDKPMVEGMPDGVPEGEVTDPALAQAGDKYATALYRIFKELWVVPSLIAESERKGLVAKVKITIGPDLKIHDYAVVQGGSGNGPFDASVLEIFKKFEKDGRTLPEPPDEIAAKLFEGGLVIRFHGKDYGG